MILRRLLLISLVAICGCNVLMSEEVFVGHGDRWVQGVCERQCDTYAWRVVPNLSQVCGISSFMSRDGRPEQILYACAESQTCTVYSGMSEAKAKVTFVLGSDISVRDHEVDMHLRKCLGHP